MKNNKWYYKTIIAGGREKGEEAITHTTHTLVEARLLLK
jgi:hypothetical protein